MPFDNAQLRNTTILHLIQFSFTVTIPYFVKNQYYTLAKCMHNVRNLPFSTRFSLLTRWPRVGVNQTHGEVLDRFNISTIWGFSELYPSTYVNIYQISKRYSPCTTSFGSQLVITQPTYSDMPVFVCCNAKCWSTSNTISHPPPTSWRTALLALEKQNYLELNEHSVKASTMPQNRSVPVQWSELRIYFMRGNQFQITRNDLVCLCFSVR